MLVNVRSFSASFNSAKFFRYAHAKLYVYNPCTGIVYTYYNLICVYMYTFFALFNLEKLITACFQIHSVCTFTFGKNQC